MTTRIHPTLLAGALAFLASTALAQQNGVGLKNGRVVDSIHGTQPLHKQVEAGVPGTLEGEFTFSTPDDGSIPDALAVLWRIVDPQGVALSAHSLESGNMLVRREWFGLDADPEGTASVVCFDLANGTGEGTLSIPLMRAESGRAYVPLAAGKGHVELAVGLPGQLQVDQDSGLVSGALWSTTVKVTANYGDYSVDVPRMRPFIRERGVLYVRVRDMVPYDRTFGLQAAGVDVVDGLPPLVTIPADDDSVQVHVQYRRNGATQYALTDPDSGVVLALSGIVIASDTAKYPLDVNNGGSTLRLPYDMDLSMPFVTELSDVAVALLPADVYTWGAADETEGDPQEEHRAGPLGLISVVSYECQEPTAHTKDTVDVCGDCHHAPLSEEQKPDCPDTDTLFKPAVCVAKVQTGWEGAQNCKIGAETKELLLFVYKWTGSRGELDCASAEITLGEWIAITIGWEFNKSCCTYQKTGERELRKVPTCTLCPVDH